MEERNGKRRERGVQYWREIRERLVVVQRTGKRTKEERKR